MPTDPNHPFHDADGTPRIVVRPRAGTVTVHHGTTRIATTDRALELVEVGYPPVLYIPKADAVTEHLSPSERRTRCPYKGIAHYFTLVGTDGPSPEDAVWIYPEPIPEVAEIAGHIAFYTDRVRIEIA